MEHRNAWADNPQKSDNGKKSWILSCLALTGFAICGVLEHVVCSVDPTPSNFSLNFSQRQLKEFGRYCDPPNMTILYEDSDEERDKDEGNNFPQTKENLKVVFDVRQILLGKVLCLSHKPTKKPPNGLGLIFVKEEISRLLEGSRSFNLSAAEKGQQSRERSLSWGMLFSYFPAILASTKIGPKKVFGYALLLFFTSSAFCSATRLKVSDKAPYLFGFLIGALVPSFFQMSVNWFAPEKRSSFLSLLSGKYLGYAICEAIITKTGLVNKNYNLYIHLGVGLAAFTWYVFWSTTISDGPQKKSISSKTNPNINDKNKLHTFKFVPMRKILSSRPIWMSVGVIFGAFCGEVGIRKALRLYLKYVYFVSGDLRIISFILHFVFAICTGYLVDYLLKIRFVSVTSSRRMVVYVSHFIPAGFLFVVGFVGCQVIAPVLFYCFASLAAGANYSGAFISPVDLSPKYAGIVVALCFTVGHTGTIFVDYLILHVLAGQVYGSWRFLFSLVSLILLISAIFFMLRGSGSTQYWNNLERDNKITKKKSRIRKNNQTTQLATSLQKPRTKSIYSVEKKILKVLHVQEPEKFTRARAYSTSSPNEKSSMGLANVYRPNCKKRASIS